MTIEVITFTATGRRRVDTAEAATPEDAVFAARILHAEAASTGTRVHVGFYVGGKLTRMVEGCP